MSTSLVVFVRERSQDTRFRRATLGDRTAFRAELAELRRLRREPDRARNGEMARLRRQRDPRERSGASEVRGERHARRRAKMVYFQGGGSIRFAVGFVAGLLLRETAQRKSKKPPRSLLVPARRDQKDGEMIFVRQLEADDFDKGFMELLAQLTSAGNVTREQWQARFAELRHGPEFVFVVEEKGRLLASGTLVLERKFARGCGLCGHIEDIVVDKQCRGRGMGLVIVTALTKVAERMGCYKVILDCSEENQPFYEKCEFKRKEVQMARYFRD
jgi:glucosamine-phosphate N-acetyltransferase